MNIRRSGNYSVFGVETMSVLGGRDLFVFSISAAEEMKIIAVVENTVHSYARCGICKSNGSSQVGFRAYSVFHCNCGHMRLSSHFRPKVFCVIQNIFIGIHRH